MRLYLSKFEIYMKYVFKLTNSKKKVAMRKTCEKQIYNSSK